MTKLDKLNAEKDGQETAELKQKKVEIEAKPEEKMVAKKKAVEVEKKPERGRREPKTVR